MLFIMALLVISAKFNQSNSIAMEKRNPPQDERADMNIDSPINTKDAHKKANGQSLTNDESADTDPEKVDDKASFKEKTDSGRDHYDGEVKI